LRCGAIAALAFILWPLFSVVFAQVSMTTITASAINDFGGNPLASGKITFTPGDNFGNAISAKGAFYRGKSCYVVTGAITTGTDGNTCQVVDALVSNPQVCYKISLYDSVLGQTIPTPGQLCAQPTGTTWSYDSYVPNMAPATLIQAGPPGPGATVAVHSVTTGSPGGSASVTNAGTSTNALLDFVVPQGPAGANGTNGLNGTNGTNGAPGQPALYVGAWSSTVTYAAGAEVSYSSACYVALVSNTNVTPVVGTTWAACAGVAGSVALTPTASQTVAQPSSPSGNTAFGVNQLQVTNDLQAQGPVTTPQRLPKKLMSVLDKAYHQVVRMNCMGTSIESFADSFCVQFAGALQAEYGAASTTYRRAFTDQTLDTIYTTGCNTQQGYQGAYFARTVCGNSGVMTHFTSSDRTTIVYDQESAGGTASVPVYIDGQVSLPPGAVTPGTGGTVNGTSSGALTCAPSGGTAIVALSCSAYMVTGSVFVSITNGGVYTSISGLSLTISGTSYSAPSGFAVNPVLTTPAWQPSTANIQSQTFGSGYVATTDPTCSISGGTPLAAKSGGSCKAFVNSSGQIITWLNSTGAYATGSATPTLAVSNAGSGSSFSATLQLVSGITFYNASGSNYRQSFDVIGLTPGVSHRITLVFPSSGASGYIEGFEDGSASGYADKGVEMLWNSRPNSKLDDFFSSCFPVGTCVSASPQAFTYGSSGGYVTGSYTSVFFAGSRVDPDFFVFGGPTNDTLQNNTNFATELNTFIAAAATHNVPGILIIEPAECSANVGTYTYGTTSGCGSGTNNSTTVWATQKAAMLAACNSYPDLLYCADEDDYVGFEKANPNYLVTPIANSGNPHTYEFFMGNERKAFAAYTAAQFGAPDANSTFNSQAAATDTQNMLVPTGMIASTTEPCGPIGMYWEDTSNSAGVKGAAATLKRKIGTTGFSFDVAGASSWPTKNQKNTGCSRGTWEVVSGPSKQVARPLNDYNTVTASASISYGTYSNSDVYALISNSSAFTFTYALSGADTATIVPGDTYTLSGMVRFHSLPTTGSAVFYCYLDTPISTYYSYLNIATGQFEYNSAVSAKSQILNYSNFAPYTTTAAQPDYDTDYHTFAATFAMPQFPTGSNLNFSCLVPAGSVVEIGHMRLDLGASIAFDTKEPQHEASGANMVVNIPASTTEPTNAQAYDGMTWSDTSSAVMPSIGKQVLSTGAVYRIDNPGPLSKGNLWQVTSGPNPDNFNLQSAQACTSLSLTGTITNNVSVYPEAGGLPATGCQDVITANTSNVGYIASTFTPSAGVAFATTDQLTLSWLYQSYPTAGNTNPNYSKPTAAIMAYSGSTAYYLQANKTWSTTAYTSWPLPYVYASDTGFRRIAISFPSPGAFSATQFVVRVYPNSGNGGTVAYTIFIGDFRLEHGASVTVNRQSSNLAPLTSSLTTTSATSDAVALPGMTSSGHCAAPAPTNSAAGSATAAYISAKAANQVTVTHAATASMTYDITCWPY
jgi:hypothetical protein